MPAWTPRDKQMLVALQAHEDSLCPGCGQPIRLSYDEEQGSWYEAHEMRCWSCAAIAEHTAGKDLAAGTRVFTTIPPSSERIDLTGFSPHEEG